MLYDAFKLNIYGFILVPIPFYLPFGNFFCNLIFYSIKQLRIGMEYHLTLSHEIELRGFSAQTLWLLKSFYWQFRLSHCVCLCILLLLGTLFNFNMCGYKFEDIKKWIGIFFSFFEICGEFCGSRLFKNFVDLKIL
jgi:hypothetical protein